MDFLSNYDEPTKTAVLAWFSRHNIAPPYNEQVKQAGKLIAQAYNDGQLYQDRQEGIVLSQSVTAGSVSTSKTYAQGEQSQPMSQAEQIALDLIKPFSRISLNGIVGRL